MLLIPAIDLKDGHCVRLKQGDMNQATVFSEDPAEMARHWLENPDTRKQVLERIPLGRVAQPEDVAGAAVFFASRASAFVTGQVLYLDGGITASQ